MTRRVHDVPPRRTRARRTRTGTGTCTPSVTSGDLRALYWHNWAPRVVPGGRTRARACSGRSARGRRRPRRVSCVHRRRARPASVSRSASGDASFVGASVVLESRPRVRHLRLVRRGRRRAHDALADGVRARRRAASSRDAPSPVPSNGAAGAGLGARLWRETRLVREVRAPHVRRFGVRVRSASRRALRNRRRALRPRAPRARRRRGAPRRPPRSRHGRARARRLPDAVVGEDDDVAVADRG